MTTAGTDVNGGTPVPGAANGQRSPKPEVRLLSVHIRRVIRTAAYESWEISEEMQAAPDPALSSRENLRLMRRLLTFEIENAVAELTAKQMNNKEA
ncbi:MAG: hypothetical protein ACREQM_09195 [Candidatus Dormibacteraceae bacterium]